MIIPGTVSKINANSSKINSLLKTIGNEVSDISSAFGDICRKMKDSRITELKIENERLEKKIGELTKELRDVRTAKGIPQIAVSSSRILECSNSPGEPAAASSVSENATTSTQNEKTQPSKQKQPKEKKTAKPAPEPKKEEEVHFGNLDLRVGKIIHVEKHPNADALYVEQVDIGDEKPRTIISGLVNHVPIEKMKDRIAMFVCNLKPAKMRGISSEGMIMCANSDGKVEILETPQGSKPGDLVTVPGFDRNPDEQLSAKKKTFELIQVDLKTNDKREATYKGVPWNVGGRGPAIAPTLGGAIIK